MYYGLLAEGIYRNAVLNLMKQKEINAVFHYVPLHFSFAGQRYGRVSGKLSNTNSLSERLICLPLWLGLTEFQQSNIIKVLTRAIC